MLNTETKLDIKQIQFEAKKLKHLSVLPMMDIYIKMYNELSDYLIIDNLDFEQGSIEQNIYNIGLQIESVSDSLINLSNTLNRINEYKE
jgi:hypothetical protein